MKKRTERVLLCLFVLLCGTKASAQWTVFDPSNLVQSIINSTNEMVETSSTAATMLKNFEETARIYQQGKQYYDKLKSVSNLVKNARKAQQCVLLVGEISDIYMDGYRRMLSDDNFSQKELSGDRLRIHPAVAGEHPCLAGSEGDYQSYGDEYDRQGPPRRHRTGSCRTAALPESHGLLYAQKHLGIPAALAQKG